MYHMTRARKGLYALAIFILSLGIATLLYVENHLPPAGDHTEMSRPTAPIAEKRDHSYSRHGITVSDPYHWLKDQSYPTVDDQDVLDYLIAENAYFEAVMADDKPQIEKLFEEMKARIKEDDASVPAKDGDYEYWWRFEAGAQYRQWLRRKIGGDDEIILDENIGAKTHEFYAVRGLTYSPDHSLLSWGEDINGSEHYTLRIKNLNTGDMLPDTITDMLGAVEWAADGTSFFYMELNDQWRPYRVRHHVLGTDAKDDRIVYEEKDSGYFTHIGTSQSRKFLIIQSGDHVTSEVRVLPLGQPTAAPVLMGARQSGVEYSVDHAGDLFYIRTNDTHANFRIMSVKDDAPQRENWEEMIPASDTVYLRGHTTFKDYMAIEARENGLDKIKIFSHEGRLDDVPFAEAAYVASLGNNPEYDPQYLRLNYESMVTPDTVYDYDVASGELITKKVLEVPSGYNANDYVTERLWATARDGVKVPISLVYKKGFQKDGNGKVHLYGYGAYGFGMPPSFSTTRLSLVDRGFAYAIAHIRGGDEMGYQWYLDGKLEKRPNTFNDFVDAAKHLIAEGYTKAGRISTSGGSAGGELMGAIANSNPELWGAIVAHVPFVDVLNTMQDESLPLTPMEWPEWGNPIESKADFELIQSYSPYDQVKAQDYAPMLVTAGLNDPRVTYWEPAKWVAKLRDVKTDDNLLLFKTNMEGGHRGKTGRFDRLQEAAEEYAFILKILGDD